MCLSSCGALFREQRVEVVGQLEIAARQRVVAARGEVDAALRAAQEVGILAEAEGFIRDSAAAPP